MLKEAIKQSKLYAKSIVRVQNPEKPTRNERLALSTVAGDYMAGYKAALAKMKETTTNEKETH